MELIRLFSTIEPYVRRAKFMTAQHQHRLGEHARVALSAGGQNYLHDWIAPILLSTVTILLVSLLLNEAQAYLTALHLWDDPQDLALAYILPTIFITVLFGSNIGLLSVLIGGLAASYFIYPPDFSFQIDRPEHLVELSFFLMLSVTACKSTAVLTDEKPLNRRLMRKRQSVLPKLGPRTKHRT